MPEGRMEQTRKVLGGSLALKIILILGFVFIVWAFLNVFSGKGNIGTLVTDILKIILGIIIITFVIWGIRSKIAKPNIPSPNEDSREIITKLAIRRKPFSVKRLVLRGEDMLTYTTWFPRIKGIMFQPSLEPKQKVTADGTPIFKALTDKANKKVYDSEKKPILVPDYEALTDKDGDWIIVGSPAPKWKFWDRTIEIVRANASLVSGIGETVYIKCTNLCHFNGYFYPNQQWQDDITRVITQNKSEALLETFKEVVNLPAQFANLALQDPTFKKWMEAKNENINAQATAPLLR